MAYRSGFVAIIGKPNAGKSTLLNALLGEKISIITRKAQTTRHRIKGILTTKDYQIVFSDTPGIIEAKYSLHSSMMKMVDESLEDADVLVVLADPTAPEAELQEVAARIHGGKIPVIVAINKSDLVSPEQLAAYRVFCSGIFPEADCLNISALQNRQLDGLLAALQMQLKEQPAFYQEDELTDRSERFIVSELIREKIFDQFNQEVPYACQVIVVDWKDQPDIVHIRAEVIVERESQKAILLGRGGSAIKALGMAARKDIESFLQKKIFLGLTVKVNANWRNSPLQLKYFGYEKS
ncbi:MAG: GTPase Era [Chitinophagales bacterium]|nr:GTPase Era [Chitinophagales bacterium]